MWIGPAQARPRILLNNGKEAFATCSMERTQLATPPSVNWPLYFFGWGSYGGPSGTGDSAEATKALECTTRATWSAVPNPLACSCTTCWTSAESRAHRRILQLTYYTQPFRLANAPDLFGSSSRAHGTSPPSRLRSLRGRHHCAAATVVYMVAHPVSGFSDFSRLSTPKPCLDTESSLQRKSSAKLRRASRSSFMRGLSFILENGSIDILEAGWRYYTWSAEMRLMRSICTYLQARVKFLPRCHVRQKPPTRLRGQG